MLKKKVKRILITGGAGYIGSHVAHLLIDKGFKVTIIDNLINGNKKLAPKRANFIKCDIVDAKKINSIFEKEKFSVVFHLAGLTSVDESIRLPKKYMFENYHKSKVFIKTCIKNEIKNIIFSSSASIYGRTKCKNISENHRLNPLNPYAKSKLLIEKYILNESKKHKLKYIILRYFNVAGADKKKRTGLISKNSTNLIKVLSEIISKKKKKIIINGKNYKTPDGTTVRDFIHVSDLADIHVRSMQYLNESKKSGIFNCGYGKGYSVLEIVKILNKLSNNKIEYRFGPRRPRDISFSVSNSAKFGRLMEWKPKYDNIKIILKSAIEWEKKLKL